MAVLITGGTGYIGSHVVRQLAEAGSRVLVVDDVATGVADRVNDIPLVRLNLASDAATDVLVKLMRSEAVTAVIHFAARKQVPESIQRPAWYMAQNIGGLANLLMAMEQSDVTRLVFSSSAAVYGDARGTMISEDDPTVPMNPYGQSKLVGEWMVEAAADAFGLRGASLRYFNVAGAGSPELGDNAALNLIPMVFERMRLGESPKIFGSDYPTKDGTCVRDFVHVQDLSDAHVAVLGYLERDQRKHSVFNVGTGTGHSVRDVIDTIAEVSGREVAPQLCDRRPGDPASVVASAQRIKDELGWEARRGLREIIQSAWDADVLLNG